MTKDTPTHQTISPNWIPGPPTEWPFTGLTQHRNGVINNWSELIDVSENWKSTILAHAPATITPYVPPPPPMEPPKEMAIVGAIDPKNERRWVGVFCPFDGELRLASRNHLSLGCDLWTDYTHHRLFSTFAEAFKWAEEGQG